MKSIIRSIAVVVAMVAATLAEGQTGSVGACTAPGMPPIGFSPVSPTSASPVTVTVAAAELAPSAVSAVVSGDKIDVTFSGAFFGMSPPAACGSVVVGPLAAGSYTVNYYLALAGSAPALQATTSLAVTESVPNYQGLWWRTDGTEAGWGINLAHQADTIVATWFTYDENGKGLWLVLTARKASPNTYSGYMNYTRGPAFNAVPFDPMRVGVYMPPWFGELHFDDPDHGTFTVTKDDGFGSPRVVHSGAIARQVFGPVPTCVFGTLPDLGAATNYTDLWWAAPAGSESGWGVNLTHQGDTIFVTWFTYDLDGTSMWLVATAQNTGPAKYSGTLYRTTGPAYFAQPFDSAKVAASEMGSIALAFANGNQATMTYSVNTATGTVEQQKSITREVFAAPGTVCH